MQSKFSGARQREQDDAPALISERESKVILQAIAAVQASVDALGLDIERLLETKDAIEAPEWVNGTGSPGGLLERLRGALRCLRR